jgi:hypothetical protein
MKNRRNMRYYMGPCIQISKNISFFPAEFVHRQKRHVMFQPGPGMKMNAPPLLAGKIIPTNEVPAGPPGPKGILDDNTFIRLIFMKILTIHVHHIVFNCKAMCPLIVPAYS